MPVGELEAKAGKNRIDMAEHLMNVEAGFDVFVAHEFSNIFVFFEDFLENLKKDEDIAKFMSIL